MATRTETRKQPKLWRSAEVTSVDVEKRTFQVVWSTGSRVRRYSYRNGPYWEELSMEAGHVRLARLNSGASFLQDHNTYEVKRTLGSVIDGSASVDGKRGIATIQYCPAGIDPEADMIFAKIAARIIRHISVGYVTHVEQETTPADEIPTLRAIDWEPYEISAVTVGADPNAGIRSHEREGEETFECITHTTRGMPPQKEGKCMTEEEKRALEAEAAKKRVEEETKKRAEEEAKIREAAIVAERQRSTQIRHAVRVASLDESFAQKLIDEGVTVDVARERAFAELEKRGTSINPTPGRADIEVGELDREKKLRGMGAALIGKAGRSGEMIRDSVEAKRRGFEKVELDPGQFRGMTLLDAARICIELGGGSTRGLYDRETIFKMAMRGANGVGMQGTSFFNVLLENVLQKTMRASYETQALTWRDWVGTMSNSDFKASSHYQKGAFGTLPVVKEGEEYKNILIPDGSKVSVVTEKRGGIIALTMEALINDDMGAIASTAADFGETAALTIEEAVYELLLQNGGLGPTLADGQPFFHSSRGNISTGSVLTNSAISLDRQKMREQKDPAGKRFLNLQPRILLVPPSLEDTARSINTDTFDHESNKLQKKNQQANLFGTIVAPPQLSGTRRYLFTDKKEAFKAVFLDGHGEGPTMSMNEGFRVDGTEWKASLFCKVNPFEPKTAITNAGTA